MKTIKKTCHSCGKEFIIQVTDDQYNELTFRIRRPIQEILPKIDANLRELFVSGICGACFDSIFSEGE